MRLEASLSGKLTEYLEKELKNAEIAVTRGVSLATNQISRIRLSFSFYLARRYLPKIKK